MLQRPQGSFNPPLDIQREHFYPGNLPRHPDACTSFDKLAAVCRKNNNNKNSE